MTDFKAKMHQIRFRLGLHQRSPDPLTRFGGRFAAGGGAGLGNRREIGEGSEREVEGREREGPQVTVEPGPLKALLRHWNLMQFLEGYTRRVSGNNLLDFGNDPNHNSGFRNGTLPLRYRGNCKKGCGMSYPPCRLHFSNVSSCCFFVVIVHV